MKSRHTRFRRGRVFRASHQHGLWEATTPGQEALGLQDHLAYRQAPPTSRKEPPLAKTVLAPSDALPRRSRSILSITILVAVAHTTNDLYASFLAPLLPRLMTKLDITIALAAALAMTLSIAASLLQPLMGYWADRLGRRYFVAAGPLLGGLFLSLIGWAPSFGVLIVVLVLGGLGSAAFHPPGASYAARLEGGKGSGVRVSIFSFAGTMGFAAGPLLVIALVSRTGLDGMWIAMIPGIVLGLIVVRALPPDRPGVTRRVPSVREVFGYLVGPLGLLFGISAIMAFAQRVYVTMEPIIVAEAGGSEEVGALGLTVFMGAQAIGSLGGGYLTDRIDRRHLLFALTALALPAYMAAVGLTPGSWGAFAAAATAGALGMAVLPPVVVMAQEILPEGAAVGSGIVMGLAWAAGSVVVLGTGVLGDLIGPQPAAVWSLPLIAGATLLTLHPGLRPHARPTH